MYKVKYHLATMQVRLSFFRLSSILQTSHPHFPWWSDFLRNESASRLMGPWTTSRCQDGTSRLSTSSQYLIAVSHLPWFSLLTQRPSIHSPPDNHRLCHWWDSSNARHYCCYQTEFWLCSSFVILLKASFFKFDISAEKKREVKKRQFW